VHIVWERALQRLKGELTSHTCQLTWQDRTELCLRFSACASFSAAVSACTTVDYYPS
jgi:hypothetical protein